MRYLPIAAILLLTTLLHAAPTSAPASSQPLPLIRMTWTIDGITREALVHLPPPSVQNPPLLFAFHGHGGTSAYAARHFRFHEIWPDALCVYPQGLPTRAPKIDPDGRFPGWQKSMGDQHDRDLAFFDAMLATFKKENHIDEHRIYVAGHSNGGYFTYTLWAARGNTFAALAPVAATAILRDAKDLLPLPILHVAGEKDPLVPFALQQLTITHDREVDHCDPTGTPAGPFCTQYTSPTGPTVIAFIHPGGHSIPPTAPERIIQFFQSQQKK